jgi:hypothetical protein
MRIEMPEKRRKYDREFREGTFWIVEETNKPIAQIARDLGVSEDTLGPAGPNTPKSSKSSLPSGWPGNTRTKTSGHR